MDTTTYYILFYKTVTDYVKKRDTYRKTHLALIQKAYENDQLLIAGALSDPADEAVLVFKEKKTAIAFAKNDPYVINGLIKTWNVRPWNTVRF